MKRSARAHFAVSILLLAGAVAPQMSLAEGEIFRVDPHGTLEQDLHGTDITQKTECKVCHFLSKGKELATKDDSSERCLSCHGSSPHSGLAEHLGKESKHGKVTCLSCHRPHRNPLLTQEPGTRKTSLMMKRHCTDCHRW